MKASGINAAPAPAFKGNFVPFSAPPGFREAFFKPPDDGRDGRRV
jgi:hypothetical protein